MRRPILPPPAPLARCRCGGVVMLAHPVTGRPICVACAARVVIELPTTTARNDTRPELVPGGVA